MWVEVPIGDQIAGSFRDPLNLMCRVVLRRKTRCDHNERTEERSSATPFALMVRVSPRETLNL
jgi:hypothetical protein